MPMRLMKRERGTCRLDTMEGRGAEKQHNSTVSCGCCGRVSTWTVTASVDVGEVRDIEWVRNAARAARWIFTGRLGWVCPRKGCQTDRVLREWRHAKGKGWAMRQEGVGDE